jgi:alpha-galactosidase
LKLGAYTDVGPKTCRGGRTGSWPHYQQDANTFAKWYEQQQISIGFLSLSTLNTQRELDMVKMDWCNHPHPFTQQQLYTNMSRALNATGRPMLFNICGWYRRYIDSVTLK